MLTRLLSTITQTNMKATSSSRITQRRRLKRLKKSEQNDENRIPKVRTNAYGRRKGEKVNRDNENDKNVTAKSLEELGDDTASLLKGLNCCFIGENERANEQVSNLVSPLLKYAPMSVSTLIEKVSKGKTREQLCEEDFKEALVVENSVHEQLSQFLRVSLATCGATKTKYYGATARGDCWAWLYGMITIWVDDEETANKAAQTPELFPQRDAYELADIRVVLKNKQLEIGENSSGSSISSSSSEEREQILRAIFAGISALCDSDEHFVGKKSLYTRMGCRGDWPILQAPEWDGSSENFNKDSALIPAQQQQQQAGEEVKKTK
jgi:hypothetical protein